MNRIFEQNYNMNKKLLYILKNENTLRSNFTCDTFSHIAIKILNLCINIVLQPGAHAYIQPGIHAHIQCKDFQIE